MRDCGTAQHHPLKRVVSGINAAEPFLRYHANVILCIGAILFSVAVAEITCRLFLPRPGFSPFQNEVLGMKVSHPTRGWTYTPNFSSRLVNGDYETEIHTNSLGFRDRPIDVSKLPKRVVLAVGDSFTSGQGVETHQTWVAEFERIINARNSVEPIKVVNAGINAYSLRQMRQTAEELVPLLHPKLIVVGLFISGIDRLTDPYVFFNGTNVRGRVVHQLKALPDGFLFSPFYKQWAMKLDYALDHYFYFGADLAKVFESFRRGQTMERRTYDSRRTQTKLLEELDSLIAFGQASGTPVVFLLINAQDHDGSFPMPDEVMNAMIAGYCEKAGVPVVDPLPRLKELAAGIPIYTFAHDIHWTSRAHAVAASELAKLVDRQHILSNVP